MRVPRLPAVVLPALLLLGACADPITGPGAPGGRLAGRKPQPTRTPILFVHGWNSSAATWTTMVGRFKRDGWTDAQLSTFSYPTSRSNAETAALIATKVDSIRLATGAPRVAIVTHSMGALSARYYVRFLKGDGKVDALVSLGGPNHGTTSAYLCLSQAACQEMAPGSGFLGTLNQDDETWGTFSRYATWRSPCDEVINPRESPSLVGASNTTTACLTHSQLKEDAGVYQQVRDWVTAPPITVLATAF
ncbi:esterase/lipase family protein [Roseisolibacter agri]|uniref:Lipase n=1 Tax=Roseisolibacter agri TaxID=2014610 RepID=A0AA37Q070_9BACT|nr:alpha/beta fold hydrolase [Roseisolibacter agri]GLC24094.1 lipase [Roseisolibacter agri]